MAALLTLGIAVPSEWHLGILHIGGILLPCCLPEVSLTATRTVLAATLAYAAAPGVQYRGDIC